MYIANDKIPSHLSVFGDDRQIGPTDHLMIKLKSPFSLQSIFTAVLLYREQYYSDLLNKPFHSSTLYNFYFILSPIAPLCPSRAGFSPESFEISFAFPPFLRLVVLFLPCGKRHTQPRLPPLSALSYLASRLSLCLSSPRP